ncbi:MAG: 3-hydroxyacyl-CoA dehydrogenase NAD-binding domain-containing protein [Deinococcales bacterium]
MSRVELERRGDVAVVWLDPEGEPVNTLSTALLRRFSELLDEIERDDAVKAGVVASRSPRSFAAGADIREFLRFTSPDEVRAVISEGQALLGRLEASRKPVVAAVHGACMGGGVELALACRAIVASDHPSTRFALPEVNLGLLPGLGGTQRLPARIGLPDALDMVLTGRSAYARKARKMGLVDVTVPQESVVDAAVHAARGLADGSWRPREPRRPLRDRLQGSAPARPLVWRTAERQVAKGGGHYPALPRVLAVMRTGIEHGRSAGFEAESKAFAELLFTPEARALIHVFFAQSAARKNPYRDHAEPRPVDTVAVLGAGLMGSGIAQVSVDKGLHVVLKDRDLELAAKGKGAVYRGLSRRVGKGVTPFQRDRAVERVTLAGDYAAVASAQITIEAVLEDVGLKREVLHEVEAVTQPGHVFASNTSAIPITRIAQGAGRPEAVVGMHYFSPVPRMPLLEVIVTDATADWAAATAVEVGLRQGKTVIVVGDGPGFYAVRVLGRFFAEAMACLREGADITLIDGAMRHYGFPMGPFELLDEVGLDVSAKVETVLAEAFAERGVPPDDAVKRLVEAGYRGRKAGKGFYRYERGKRTHEVDRHVYQIAGLGSRRAMPEADIQERLSLALLDEAVRCLDEGVLRSPVDGDVGALFGFAFPYFLGGPFFLADRIGAAALVQRLRALEGRHGPQFAPAPGLVRRAESGERFHPQDEERPTP